MNNLLSGTGIGTVFVDLDMRILRFTPSATEFINLLHSDIGRPVGHIASNLKNYDNLVEDTQEVLDTLVPKETEVQTQDGEWFAMRIQPYRTVKNVIEGAVLTFIDISELKQMQEELYAAHARLSETLVAVAREPLLVLDTDLRVILASSAFYDTFQVTADTARGQRLWVLKNNQWDIPALRRLLKKVAEQGTTIRDYQFTHEFEDCGRCTMRINAHRAAGKSGASALILLTVEKVTGND